jgi:hypothetical protein
MADKILIAELEQEAKEDQQEEAVLKATVQKVNELKVSLTKAEGAMKSKEKEFAEAEE